MSERLMQAVAQGRVGAVVGRHDENTLDQLAGVAETAVTVSLMADGHLGYWMPVGGVAAFRDRIPIAGVGYDIGCGNCAVRLDLKDYQLDFGGAWDPKVIADDLWHSLSFGIGRKNTSATAPVDDPLFEDPAWDVIPEEHREKLRGKARQQLGTIGSGNHYVDVFQGDDGWLWVGVHFGSRGLGHTLASGFLSLSADKPWGERVPEHPGFVDLSKPIGQDYLAAMHLAGHYAHIGREWVCRYVADLLGAQITRTVHNHHNFAWREVHSDEFLWVVRKGATPAWPGQEGFVGGSMGDDAVILHGATSITHAELQRDNLYSTVHGAGRVMSRTAATGKTRRGKVKAAPGVDRVEMEAWLTRVGVVRRGGDLDEAPQAYRRLTDVLDAQGPTVEVEVALRPRVVCMAGSDEVDPFKD